MAKQRPETATPATSAPTNPAAAPAPQVDAADPTVDPNAPVAPGAPGGAVVEEVAKPKKAKKQKYRTAKDPKLTEMPLDWDPSVHLALEIEDFENHAPLLEWRADQYEQKAKDCRAEAAELRTLGSPQQRKAASRLRGITSELEKLKSTLGGTAVNMEEILAEIAAQCVVTE